MGVIGDSTFMHSGITGLVNIAYNELQFHGHHSGQLHHRHDRSPAEPHHRLQHQGGPAATKIDLETLCRAVGINRVRVVDPYNLAQCDKAVKEELAADEPSVIISRRPCALLKYVKAQDAPPCQTRTSAGAARPA